MAFSLPHCLVPSPPTQLQADGMDVLAVKQVTAFAKKYALEHGPIILELDTYRCDAAAAAAAAAGGGGVAL